MTGDPVTQRILHGIAVILFGIAITLAGSGGIGITVAFFGLLIAALARSATPRT